MNVKTQNRVVKGLSKVLYGLSIVVSIAPFLAVIYVSIISFVHDDEIDLSGRGGAILIATFSLALVNHCAIIVIKLPRDMNELKEMQHKNISPDRFFLDSRNEREPNEQILLKAKKLRCSGGRLSTLIRLDNFKSFLEKPGNEIKLLFPNPTNDKVLDDYIKYIIVEDEKKQFKKDIIDSLERLLILKNLPNTKAKIEFKFCDYAVTYGIQIVEYRKEKNNKIYVELYTMHTDPPDRASFSIERKMAILMYEKVELQFVNLWKSSLNPEEIEMTKLLDNEIVEYK